MAMPTLDQLLEIAGAVSALCTVLARVVPKGSKIGKFFEAVGVSFGRHK